MEARMKKPRAIRVMIAEDNVDVVRTIVDCLSEKRDIEIVAIESDGMAAVNAALLTQPDVMVLDIVLCRWDGFAVMQQLRERGLSHTRIIVLSSLSSDFMINRALQCGAYYYMVKPFQPELLYCNIVQIAPCDDEPAPAPKPVGEEETLQMLLTDVLGLSQLHKGTEYLKACVLFCLEFDHAGGQLTKLIYPAVARLYGSNTAQVERAIRHAIESAWNRGPMRICGLFHGGRRPTNGEVIVTLADRSLLKR